jgi:hypothetical protein
MSTREQVMQALYALGTAMTWADPANGQPVTFASQGRRLKSFTDINGADFPALFQVEGDEEVQQRSNLPYKVTLNAAWVIYHHVGMDRSVNGVATNNAITDAVFTALAPTGGDVMNQRLTLGGLAYHVWVKNKVFKDPGDVDGQGVVIVPIAILLP